MRCSPKHQYPHNLNDLIGFLEAKGIIPCSDVIRSSARLQKRKSDDCDSGAEFVEPARKLGKTMCMPSEDAGADSQNRSAATQNAEQDEQKPLASGGIEGSLEENVQVGTTLDASQIKEEPTTGVNASDATANKSRLTAEEINKVPYIY